MPDTYTLKARVSPMFIVLFPFILLSALISPKTDTLQVVTGSALFTIAFSILAAQFSRDSGKSKERNLWNSWGGAPTIQLLRHSNSEINPIKRSRIHNKLQEILPELKMPSPKEEGENPQKADEIYEVCIGHLRTKTRDIKKYPLIFKENINYGFLRNLWGLKKYGILISLMGSLVSLYITFMRLKDSLISYESVVVLLINVGLFFFWIFWVNPKRVKLAAYAYAERLLEYCE